MADLSRRAFETLLKLYPRGFRDEYGREIALLFEDRYRRASTRGEKALVWLDSITGLAQEIPKEHLSVILHDLRYALRTLRLHPMFAAAIIVTLALGIGANSAVFSLINSVAMRVLPVQNPGELFNVLIEAPRPMPQRFSYPMYAALREATPSVRMAAMSRVTRLHARPEGAGELEVAATQLVSGEYFDMLDIRPVMGRLLTPEDNLKPGAHPVAVISHSYWQRRYGGASDILGKPIELSWARFTIIGVAGPGFAGVWLESPTDVWVPIAMQHEVRYSQNFSASDAQTDKPWMPQERILWLNIIGRAPETARPAVRAALNQSLMRLMPEAEKRGVRFELESFGTGFSRLRERFLNPLYILMAMAALVLLIACANAANLLLARAAGRQREIAIRLSLGAGRSRLIQQLLTESFVLVALAGAASLLLSQWAGNMLVRLASDAPDAANRIPVETDLNVLGFTMAVAILTTLLFGLAPALQASRAELSGTLKSGSRSLLGGTAAGGHARILVVLQVALSLVLVTATGLLIRSFHNLTTVELGFDRDHVVTANIAIPSLNTFPQHLFDRLKAIPGVTAVSYAACGIADGCRSVVDGYTIEGYDAAPNEEIAMLVNSVGADYFRATGMRLVEGRAFDDRDTKTSKPVAVVNLAMAKKYFPGGSAVGRRIGLDGKLTTEIIGVVADARVLNVRETPAPMAFYAAAQNFQGIPNIAVRTAGDPAATVNAVRKIISEALPDAAIRRVTPLAVQVEATLALDRLILALTSTFGALALGLAGFGLFGILSFAVARRTAEFGLRIALGASTGHVLWKVSREALLLALAGIALGIPAVFFASRILRLLLFEVAPYDWAALLGSGLTLITVAAVAAFVPAWRASRVDPVTSLRIE